MTDPRVAESATIRTLISRARADIVVDNTDVRDPRIASRQPRR